MPRMGLPTAGTVNRAELEWAKDVLARVIRQTGENPDAVFSTEALEAAALMEEHDLATFSRYRRNLKERRVSITVLDAGLRRLKSARRSIARAATAASAVARRRGRGRELKLPESQPWPTPVHGATLLDQLSTTIRTYMVMAVEAVHAVALWVLFTYLLDVFDTARAWPSPRRKSAAARPLYCRSYTS